ncbi:alpha/beta hydrolase [Streptomyces mirabilis]|uniref:alpha/beta fold hydrolase n=1 Tax=Streptomyces mirabilis TaxID=68239 RepID=UPI00340B9667
MKRAKPLTSGISSALSEHVYVVTPTHPGFDGTPRPERFDTVAGNSIGGWIAAEMALRDNHGRIGALTLLNAVGIHAHMKENRVVDPRALALAGVSQLSFANAQFRPDFASFSDAQRAAAVANQKTLAVYGGEGFTYDPKLRGRLHRVTVPVLVVWGEEDGIAPLKYGRGYADSFPDGHFAPIPDAGHFPQIEQMGRTLGAIADFVSAIVKPDASA